jgi:hypothetical protein
MPRQSRQPHSGGRSNGALPASAPFLVLGHGHDTDRHAGQLRTSAGYVGVNWALVGSALRLSQITWRRSVAPHPTEDRASLSL